jgi:amino acid transporter
MLTRLRQTLIGAPLPSAGILHERLNKIQALAVFSSDALSSVAYATEEILLVLVVAGTVALDLSLPIALAIVALLAIIATSYYQTIHGYPSGGGAFIVAYDNLGIWPGLTAAAALLIDYVLTVAVSITAGVAAFASAFPVLIPYRVELCLLAIVLIAWANLRGVRESGTLFSIPTYGFLLLFLTLIATGLIRWFSGTLPQNSAPVFPTSREAAGALTLFLVLRAFVSGRTALTGVEAISNGIPAFRRPEAENAGKTLIAMALLLGTMFLGISFLARSLVEALIESERAQVPAEYSSSQDGALHAVNPFSVLTPQTPFIHLLPSELCPLRSSVALRTGTWSPLHQARTDRASGWQSAGSRGNRCSARERPSPVLPP